MLASLRREKIVELISEDGSAKVVDLARIFKVTEATIRQDLEKLEHEGLLVREHGGAYIKNFVDLKSNSLERRPNIDKKEIIANKCMEFINNGDSIILDSGSTTTEIAKKIKGKRSLNVITNALNIALILGGEPGIELNVTARVQPPTVSHGQNRPTFTGLIADKLFLATRHVEIRSYLPQLKDLWLKGHDRGSRDNVL